MFQFKRFSVEHEHSSMKVGTDGILLGAWAEIPSEAGARVLDAGCGCGLIALMAAQRSPLAEILAIDIDESSVEEAARNFSVCSWAERLHARLLDFRDLAARSDVAADAGSYTNEQFHLIISNPPFFNDSLKCPEPARNKARHTDTLSFADLLSGSEKLLHEGGRLALILPPEAFRRISDMLPDVAPTLRLQRFTEVYSRQGKPCERVLVQWVKGGTGLKRSSAWPSLLGVAKVRGTLDVRTEVRTTLVIRDAHGNYTPEYLDLVRDFYVSM